MYREGLVDEVDEARSKARVRFPDDGTVSGWLSVLHRNTLENQDYHLPDEGEFVACMLDPLGEHGCILGAVYSSANKPPGPSRDVRRVTFSDGAVVEYDRAASELRISGVTKVMVEATVVQLSASEIEELTIGGGAAALSRDDKVQQALADLKSALSAGAPTPQDGGAGLKSTILAQLSAWPPATAAGKVTSD